MLSAANWIVPSVRQIAGDGHMRAPRTSTRSPLLLTTQDQVAKTIEAAANYGGSLDVILDDA